MMRSFFNHRGVRGVVRLATLSVIGVFLGAGVSACSGSGSVDPTAEARRWEFREQLILATRAINQADLDQAKLHVQKARSRAFNFEQQRQVEGLTHLIAGAEALRQGDGARARSEWSQIEDPALLREVRGKARAIGIEVTPDAVANRAEQEKESQQ